MKSKYVDLIKPLIEEGWFTKLEPFFNSNSFDAIIDKLKEEKKLGKLVTPLDINCFKAFKECPYDKFKVLIVGQDPYPGLINKKMEADGLAFSYTKYGNDDSHIPKSLKIILREVERDVYKTEDNIEDLFLDTNLKRWANQGVLLLNSSLTTVVGNSNAHQGLWNPLILEVFKIINDYNPGLIVMLWGKNAQEFKKYLNNNNYILEAPHPAAQFYSGGKITFSGCGHFSKCNELIKENNGEQYCIRW